MTAWGEERRGRGRGGGGGDRDGGRSFDVRAVVAVTFDFGDTLVPVSAPAFRAVVRAAAGDVVERLALGDRDAFLTAWVEERDRQVREDVLEDRREMSMARRFARLIARSRGMPAPPPDVRWDDGAVDALVDPAEVAWALDAYRDRWVAGIPVPAGVDRVLAAVAATRRVGILSNWPHTETIEAFVDRAGWRPYLSAVVVSAAVDAIKPDPAIFRAAERALGMPETPPGSILHVGDDPRADVAGARRAGWRAAWLHADNAGSPLPGAGRDPEPGAPGPDVEIDALEEIVEVLGPVL
ncbi:MAG: HAD family hydrolase [Chloroflexi bacterium]|jgi:FMN phosphatase YigB (HAD superfamily)|nr:HAD family hydrolase [Chloroflexota bacterium]